MKIDTNLKTVEVSWNETLGDVVEQMMKMFPEDWKSFKIQGPTVTLVERPLTPVQPFEDIPPSPIPNYPWEPPTLPIICYLGNT